MGSVLAVDGDGGRDKVQATHQHFLQESAKGGRIAVQLHRDRTASAAHIAAGVGLHELRYPFARGRRVGQLKQFTDTEREESACVRDIKPLSHHKLAHVSSHSRSAIGRGRYLA